ncbi:nuclear transport factor 2 family protein [Roseibium sp. SCP14]|uniref:nuclear transport factor 2 family protein n=1 Tax=Roseibium sp. SCP14 TaxID=3141375 RepID=UPI00333AC9F4
MTSDGNLTALKHCYERWHETKGESTEDWLALMDDRVDFRSLAMAQTPEIGFTAPRTGKEEVRYYLDGLLEDWSMEHYTIDDYVVDGDRICAVGTTAWVNKSTGARASSPKLDYVRFKDGKIIAFHEFYDTAALIAAACGK